MEEAALKRILFALEQAGTKAPKPPKKQKKKKEADFLAMLGETDDEATDLEESGFSDGE